MKKTFEPKGWMKDVLVIIDGHEAERDSEANQSVPDFLINKALSVTVSMPRGSGHTTFANWIAHLYPAVVVYGDIRHYITLTESFPLNSKTDMLSMFEIYYALHRMDGTQPTTKLIEDLRARFQGQKVVVVDNAERVPQPVKDFVLDVAPCCVVFLGK